MATLNVVLHEPSNLMGNGARMPCANGRFYGAETLDPADCPPEGAVICPPSPDRYYWTVTADDGDMWVNFDAPAVAGSCWLIKDGTTRDFGAEAGQFARVAAAT